MTIQLLVNYEDDKHVIAILYKHEEILDRCYFSDIEQVGPWVEDWFPNATLHNETNNSAPFYHRWFSIEPCTD